MESEPKISILAYVFATVAGIPILLAGMIACATIVGIPIGILLIILSGYPLYRLHRRAAHLSAERKDERHTRHTKLTVAAEVEIALEAITPSTEQMRPPWDTQ